MSTETQKSTGIEIDPMYQELFDRLELKKAEVDKAEKPVYVTGGHFRYSESGYVMDITTERNQSKLVDALTFLIGKSENHKKACEELSLNLEFKWMGFTYDEWFADIKTRIDSINIAKRRAELQALEIKINAVLPPEVKQAIELKKIQLALA